jgi:hypothetical protein
MTQEVPHVLHDHILQYVQPKGWSSDGSLSCFSISIADCNQCPLPYSSGVFFPLDNAQSRPYLLSFKISSNLKQISLFFRWWRPCYAISSDSSIFIELIYSTIYTYILADIPAVTRVFIYPNLIVICVPSLADSGTLPTRRLIYNAYVDTSDQLWPVVTS